jgi:hypothetical protein
VRRSIQRRSRCPPLTIAHYRGEVSVSAVWPRASFTATGGWLSPSQVYAESRSIVDLIRDEAAKTLIKVHKLRGSISIFEGSGGNIAVLTGSDCKVFIDAGITASRPRILEAANSLNPDPIRHLINTHWHFDHTDGNTWLNAEGAAIIGQANRHFRRQVGPVRHHPRFLHAARLPRGLTVHCALLRGQRGPRREHERTSEVIERDFLLQYMKSGYGRFLPSLTPVWHRSCQGMSCPQRRS